MQLWFWVCSNSSSLMLLVMPVWNKSLMDTLLHSDLTDTTHDYKNTLQLGVINLLHKICTICTHLTSPRAAIASGRVRNELKMKLSYCSWNGYLGTSTPTEDVTLAMLQLLWYHTRSMAWVVDVPWLSQMSFNSGTVTKLKAPGRAFTTLSKVILLWALW